MIGQIFSSEAFYSVQPNSREWTMRLSALWLWLGLGICTLMSMLREQHDLSGWELYWLVIAPACNLVAVRWRPLAAAFLSRVRAGRRQRWPGVQARLVQHR